MIQIFDSRITFIAGACFFDHQWAAPPADDPAPWVFAHYRKEFNWSRGGNWPKRYDLAWYEQQPSTFWRHYLGDRLLGEVTAEAAWEALTPLRLVDLLPKQLATTSDERVFAQIYGYPHGVVAAVTIHGPSWGQETLDQWRIRLSKLRSRRVFELEMYDGLGPQELTIEGLLDHLLQWHRVKYYPGARQVIRSHSPISLNMMVQAEGADPAVPVDAAVQRVLHAVTAWPKAWQSAKLPALGSETAFLPVGGVNVAEGDILYAVGRGRTWWRPGLFARQPAAERPRLHTLSCLLHNAAAGAVQAESLRLFAKGYRQWPEAGKRLDPAYVRKAAGQIDAMLRGAGTYRSLSLRALLADSNSRSDVNTLLTAKGFPAIGKIGEQGAADQSGSPSMVGATGFEPATPTPPV